MQISWLKGREKSSIPLWWLFYFYIENSLYCICLIMDSCLLSCPSLLINKSSSVQRNMILLQRNKSEWEGRGEGRGENSRWNIICICANNALQQIYMLFYYEIKQASLSRVHLVYGRGMSLFEAKFLTFMYIPPCTSISFSLYESVHLLDAKMGTQCICTGLHYHQNAFLSNKWHSKEGSAFDCEHWAIDSL